MPEASATRFPEAFRADSTESPSRSRPAEGEIVSMFPPYRGETYYDVPPIKHSHYKWRTAAAFFGTGLAGGSQALAALMDLLGCGEARSVARTGRYLALGCGAASTGLLIGALHTRQRWYNMLRIFKRTSPMSIGIWSIAPFGVLSGLTAAGQLAEDMGHETLGRRAGRVFGIPAALIGAVSITYMGTELEETNMPLWASAYPLMAPFYAAVGMSNSAAALLLAADRKRTPDRIANGIRDLFLVFGATEFFLGALIQNRWGTRPENRSYGGSVYELLFLVGGIGAGMVVPLVLVFLERIGEGRFGRFSTPACLVKLAGGVLAQTAVIYGGRASGKHVRDYFEYTRAERISEGDGSGFPHGKSAPPANRRSREKISNRPVAAGKSRKLRKRSARSPAGSPIVWGIIAVGAALLVSCMGKGGESP